MFCKQCLEISVYGKDEICSYCKEEERGGWVFVVWDWKRGKILAYSRINSFDVPVNCQIVAIKASKLRSVCERL